MLPRNYFVQRLPSLVKLKVQSRSPTATAQATERPAYLTSAPALAIASFPGRGRGVVALRAFAQGELVELFVARPDQVDLAAIPLNQVSPATLRIAAGGGEQNFRIAIDRTELENVLRMMRHE